MAPLKPTLVCIYCLLFHYSHILKRNDQKSLVIKWLLVQIFQQLSLRYTCTYILSITMKNHSTFRDKFHRLVSLLYPFEGESIYRRRRLRASGGGGGSEGSAPVSEMRPVLWRPAFGRLGPNDRLRGNAENHSVQGRIPETGRTQTGHGVHQHLSGSGSGVSFSRRPFYTENGREHLAGTQCCIGF